MGWMVVALPTPLRDPITIRPFSLLSGACISAKPGKRNVNQRRRRRWNPMKYAQDLDRIVDDVQALG